MAMLRITAIASLVFTASLLFSPGISAQTEPGETIDPQEYIAQIESGEITSPLDYNELLIECSDWADSNEKNAMAYRDGCVAPIYNAYFSRKLKTLIKWYFGSKGLSKSEENTLAQINPFALVREIYCQGFGDDRTKCMQNKLNQFVDDWGKKLWEDRRKARRELEWIREGINSELIDLKRYAGHPMCQEILDLASVQNGEIMKYLVKNGYLEVGTPYENDHYGVGPDIMSVIERPDWTFEESYEIPTHVVADQNESNQELEADEGCFPGDTKVTRLQNGRNPVSDYEVSLLKPWAFENLKRGSVKIKDIEDSNVILSSTIAAVLDERFHLNQCWAPVSGKPLESTLGDFGYDGFYKITYSPFGESNTYTLMATGYQRLYGSSVSSFLSSEWIQAKDLLPQKTYLYCTKLWTRDDIKVTKVEPVRKKPKTKIYSLTLPTFVFIVGEGILAHNMKYGN